MLTGRISQFDSLECALARYARDSSVNRLSILSFNTMKRSAVILTRNVLISNEFYLDDAYQHEGESSR